jgi:prolyl 4-hydroxylase
MIGTIIIIGIFSTSSSSSRPRTLTDANYQFHEIPNFLTAEETDQLIQLATSKGVEESRVYQQNRESLNTSFRKSQQAWLKDSDHSVINNLSRKVAALSNLPVSHQEELQVAVYHPGGKFDAHFDACDERLGKCDGMNRYGGPRLMTVLIYLNDNYQGGTTSFPNLGRTIRPEKGKAIVFWNVDPGNYELLRNSMHSGDPLHSGEKWIANKWVHVRPLKG